MDDADRAQLIEARFTAEAIARHHEARRYSMPAASCVECGEAISVKRRKAVPGAKRCTECQADFERSARR